MSLEEELKQLITDFNVEKYVENHGESLFKAQLRKDISQIVSVFTEKIQLLIRKWKHQKHLMNTNQGASCCELFVSDLEKVLAELTTCEDVDK